MDDPTYAKFMATLEKDPDLRRRLIVDLPARTGTRAGEISGLRDDGVFRLGSEHRLRIWIGKLHNGRTVPLHRVLVELTDDDHSAPWPERIRALGGAQRRTAT